MHILCLCVCACSLAQSCLTLCDCMDCSPILEWVTTSYSRGSSLPRGQTQVSCVSGIGRWILYHCTTWEARYCVDMHIHMINKYGYILYTHTHACFLASQNWYWLVKHSKMISLGKIIKYNERNCPGYFKPDFSFLLCKERRGRRSVFSCDLNTVLFSKGVESGCDQWSSFHQPHWTATVCLSLCLTSVVFLFEELIWLQI